MEGDKKVIAELIRRQMAILGSEITMGRVKNVPGIEVDSSGEVVSIQGDPQAVLADLTNQFIELSGLIVKKTMESILSAHPVVASPTPAPTAVSLHSQPGSLAHAQSAPAATIADRQVLTAHKEIEELNRTLNAG